MSPSHLRIPLAEDWKPGQRLGRHINHDPRSLRYLTPQASAAPATVLHHETIGVLDQGNLGSCTGNAFTAMLGTAEFADELPKGTTLDEKFAVQRYSRATQVDDYLGTYKPTDTGSDGLSVCKAAQVDGLISGYTHATSLAAAWTMIVARPFILGINWYEGMDQPDVHGRVEIAGKVRGGHELCAVGWDAAAGTFAVKNSWGELWGDSGHFYLTADQFTRLLGEKGDATQAVPLSQPAPTPTPTPSGRTVTLDEAQAGALDAFAAEPHHWHTATVAAAAWRAVTG